MPIEPYDVLLVTIPFVDHPKFIICVSPCVSPKDGLFLFISSKVFYGSKITVTRNELSCLSYDSEIKIELMKLRVSDIEMQIKDNPDLRKGKIPLSLTKKIRVATENATTLSQANKDVILENIRVT